MDINHTVIAPYSAADMYALVDDIDKYPEFLPWCTGATVKRNDNIVEAQLDIGYHGFNTAFSTRNVHTPSSSISMDLNGGPLSTLHGAWSFIPIEKNRCRIEFKLHYEFSNKLMGSVLNKIFTYIFNDFVDHFINRAHSTYRRLQIEIVQAADAGASVHTLNLSPGATVADALNDAGIAYSPSVSIFGQLADASTPLNNGDRIEINQPLPTSPQQARRQRQ